VEQALRSARLCFVAWELFSSGGRDALQTAGVLQCTGPSSGTLRFAKDSFPQDDKD